MDQLTFTCPVCGADVPRGAKACPDCGACEKSGWSEDRYLDGVNLPGEDFDDEYSSPRRLGGRAGAKTNVQWFWIVVAVIIVISMAWMTMRSVW